MMRFRLSICWALTGTLLAGCRHTAVAPAAPDEGSSSYRFLTPDPASSKKAGVGIPGPQPLVQTINAQPILPLAVPVYPPVALKARAGMATVGVRITVDTAGRVENVQPSLALVTIPAAFSAEFQAAVEEAVKQWRFRPAEFRQLELVKDPGGDFQRVVKRENVAWAFDVEFTFNATGDVLTRLPANQ